MKKEAIKKLTLNKSTITHLTVREMAVQGGVEYTDQPRCTLVLMCVKATRVVDCSDQMTAYTFCGCSMYC